MYRPLRSSSLWMVIALSSMGLMLKSASAADTVSIDTPANLTGLNYAEVKSMAVFAVGGAWTTTTGMNNHPNNIYITMVDPRNPGVIVSSALVNISDPNGARYSGSLTAPTLSTAFKYTVKAQIRVGTTVTGTASITVNVTP